MRSTVTVTNAGKTIRALPEVDLTVRFGELGRQTAAFTDATLRGLPEPDNDVKVLPGTTYTTDVGIAVPPQAAGQPVVAAAEVTERGLAVAEAAFFSGTLPGTHTPVTEPTFTDPGPSGSPLPLGRWSVDGTRLGPATLAPGDSGQRTVTLELSVANTGTTPRPSLGINVSLLSGDNLTERDSVTASIGYLDAAIAPGHTATVILTFSVPEQFARGSVVFRTMRGISDGPAWQTVLQ